LLLYKPQWLEPCWWFASHDLQPHPHPKLTNCEAYKLQHTSSPNAIHSLKVGIRIQAPTNIENQ
jgi:hypothetical protein